MTNPHLAAEVVNPVSRHLTGLLLVRLLLANCSELFIARVISYVRYPGNEIPAGYARGFALGSGRAMPLVVSKTPAVGDVRWPPTQTAG